MKIKEILIICIIIICCIFSFQAVSAADDGSTTDDMVLTSTDVSAYSLPNLDNQLQSGSGDAGSFSDLQNDTKNGGSITLDRNYTYNSSSDSGLAGGISITKDTVIDGQGIVTIDAVGYNEAMSRYSELLKQPTAPDMYGVAKAFASKFRWQIYPSGDTALNYFGLSTQIPAKLLFISNGPSRTLETQFGTIYFKHSALRETSFRYMESGLVVQALREIGQANSTEDVSARIKNEFNERLLDKVRHDLVSAANWIQQAIN